MRRALITGITGQDGSYLAELLLEKGYEVHGIIRRASTFNTGRIDKIFDRLHLHYGDLLDSNSLRTIVEKAEPDEVYNLGAQSHVRTSFEIPDYTMETIALGTLRLLEAVRLANPKIRFYQASSSEMYGNSEVSDGGRQDEDTPFSPCSPYGIAKVAAYWTAVNYRNSYGMFVSNGILFNHESPRRGETFVTRKIAKAAVRISQGLQKELVLGNLDAQRDWGYAPEYVDAMWRMLQHRQGDDFVIATGETYTVREFLEEAFRLLSLDWQDYVRIDPRLYRPTEVDVLCGQPIKAICQLGWRAKTKFKDLVRIMIEAELHGE